MTGRPMFPTVNDTNVTFDAGAAAPDFDPRAAGCVGHYDISGGRRRPDRLSDPTGMPWGTSAVSWMGWLI
ncbi:hypothetical protein CTRI78_v009628 [Colletotrichum trifolii]|uniref:Uncharacterized protein n=1 Tax=Colletotrichum trifolii TaxID=5466 RepID=A0A4R8QQ78_COLTR|nr:hypothetical protein CTRI78_v009628 [Colletotrichum trifolii]